MDMIEATMNYLFFAYPKGLRVSRLFDPLGRSILEESGNLAWPSMELFEELSSYSQEQEQDTDLNLLRWHDVTFQPGDVDIFEHESNCTPELSGSNYTCVRD